MPSELDNALNSVADRLSVDGGPLETIRFERFGTTLPMLKLAPATLPDYMAMFCTQHGTAEFIIDGELRLTFAQTHAAARIVAGGLVSGHGVQRGMRIGIAARNSANSAGCVAPTTAPTSP